MKARRRVIAALMVATIGSSSASKNSLSAPASSADALFAITGAPDM